MNTQVVPFGVAKPAAKFQLALGAQQESLADGIGASYGVLHYKGKVWSLRYRGKSYVISRPDDGTPANSVDVIILNQAHTKSKSFYPKWDPNTSDGERPICASLDGITPDADVQEKQAEACAICPKNRWYTGPDGRNKRDCTDYKRLAVLLLPSTTTRLLGQQLTEAVFLRVPPASLNDLSAFGERMNAMGWHYASFVTNIAFDPTSEFPKFTFKEVVPLTDADADLVLSLREDPQTLRIIGNDTIAIPGAARLAAPVQQPAIAAPPPQQPTTLFTPPQMAVPNAPPLGVPLTTGLATMLPPDTGTVAESDTALDEKIRSVLGI